MLKISKEVARQLYTLRYEEPGKFPKQARVYYYDKNNKEYYIRGKTRKPQSPEPVIQDAKWL